MCSVFFFIGHLKQNYSTAELCLEELGGLMVWIPGYSSHTKFNLEVDFSLLRETDDWAWWTLQLMLITGMKWAAPLLYVLGKSPKLAQKWGWKLLLRWGLSKSICGIYKELSQSELLPGTQESPLHPPEYSWLGSSLGDYTSLNFSFFLSVSRRREQRSTVILPKWSIAVEYGVQARLSFWKAGWFFKYFAWQSRLVPEKVCALSSLCHSAQRKCLSVHVRSCPQGYSASRAGFLFHRQETCEGWQSASSVSQHFCKSCRAYEFWTALKVLETSASILPSEHQFFSATV